VSISCYLTTILVAECEVSDYLKTQPIK